jgi:NADH-quinone oxidoreductase subunit J
MDQSTFFVLAPLLVVFAIMVVSARSPVYSALSLIMLMSIIAVYFLFLDAHMVGWLQVIVYAGAVMVLFLFVIMLLNLQGDVEEHQRPLLKLAGIGGGALLAGQLGHLLYRTTDQVVAQQPLPEGFGTVALLSEKLFTDFLLPFEITSVLLLVAAVGAVVLAKR